MPYEADKSEGQPWLRSIPQCPLAAEKLHAIGMSLNLTARELQIIHGLLDGRHEDTIARELGISRHTVHAHLGRVYKKLNVDCCTGLLLRIFNKYVALEPAASDPTAVDPTESAPLRLRVRDTSGGARSA